MLSYLNVCHIDPYTVNTNCFIQEDTTWTHTLLKLNKINTYFTSYWQKCVSTKVAINWKISAPWPNLSGLKSTDA